MEMMWDEWKWYGMNGNEVGQKKRSETKGNDVERMETMLDERKMIDLLLFNQLEQCSKPLTTYY